MLATTQLSSFLCASLGRNAAASHEAREPRGHAPLAAAIAWRDRAILFTAARTAVEMEEANINHCRSLRSSAVITPDEKSYAYDHQRSSSELYLAEGLKISRVSNRGHDRGV